MTSDRNKTSGGSDDPPTTDNIRSRTDSENLRDKVAFPDPAAAPLGTDAEAGNRPPTAAERRVEQEAESGLSKNTDDRQNFGPLLFYLMVAGLLALAVAAIVLLTG